MKKIICENIKNNKRITFTYDFPFFLIAVDGIHSIIGTVKTVSSAFSDGETYVGTSIKKRNIIISGIIKDNFEERRQLLYNTFPLKQEGFFYYEENELKRKIKYIVEDVDIEEKGIPRKYSISLICPNPHFTDIEDTEVEMASWTPKFQFPMISDENDGIEFATKNITTMAEIVNNTNIDFGLTIKFIANGPVNNPYLINVNTQEKIQIEKSMVAGDQIIVTTYRGNKNIIFISNSTGISENINNLMKYGSKFLKIHNGTTTIRAGADNGENSLITKVYYCNEYEAI